MKKQLTFAVAILLAIASCKKTDNAATAENPEITQRNCASMEVLEQQIAADPQRAQRLEEIEQFTQRFINEQAAGRTGALTSVTIPVVVNVVYNAADQNISDQQIQSQIDVLNEDYNKRNADNAQVPSEFQGVNAAANITFVLDHVVRKSTTVTSWGTNDAVKKTAQGGQDPYQPDHFLNMWACNLGSGLLGYAQFPGGSLSTDGVVILYSAFGSRAKYAGGTYISKYDLGRTATHEVGHWLNLRHIWGDRNCGTDYVDDTPTAQTSNYGCPVYPYKSKCQPRNHAEMTMNYMDYTDDRCMYMFTAGQSSRMNAIFASGGPRFGF